MIIDYRQIHGNEYGFPAWLMEKLDCPAAGEGVHIWIFRVGLSLKHYVGIDEAEEIVEEHMTREENPPGEIHASLVKAYASESDGSAGRDYEAGEGRSVGERQLPDEKLRNPALVWNIHNMWWQSKKPALQTLKEFSNPIPDRMGIINHLYSDGEWICVGKALINDQGQKLGYTAYSVQKKASVEIDPWSQIVPNPMRGEKGRTQAGRESERSLENAALHRKYAVTDFDFTLEGTFGEVIRRVMDKEKLAVRDAIHEMTARLILYLADYHEHIPLLMVVDSGNKSLQAWWGVDQLDEDAQRNWFFKTVPMGTDSTIFKSNNQFVRMPFGLREITEVVQSVIYWGL
jgi:hypothetical protein